MDSNVHSAGSKSGLSNFLSQEFNLNIVILSLGLDFSTFIMNYLKIFLIL